MTYIMRLFLLTSTHRGTYLKMRVLERNASDGVNPIILIQFGSLYLTRLILSAQVDDSRPFHVDAKGRGGQTSPAQV